MESSKALLGLLGVRASYGYDLKHDYDRLFGARKALAFGQVYATLARLLRDGKIEAVGDEAGEGPDRKKYAVTDAGRKAITEWITTPDVPNEAMQSNLFAKTVIAIINGDDAQHILDAQRAAHMARMRELTRQKLTADIGAALLADYTLFHIEADLRWIDITIARLGELRSEVTA
ncbi:PadR family transcriptional regulator [Microbacterium sp. NC79]|uniref:PadR family transcriptional regulator n=1 Tax=Microbacterium sp. NC79 TaxID=2851009 RepID=UPI001C2C91FE|nr:PadR family transcriptional regulator [Microbacterium sp. NC79]MBV0893996.1 PadR family transcriptional regulator [Microbacterium sp. NC79]